MARPSSRLFYTTLGAAFALAGFVATQAAAEIRWPWNADKTSCATAEVTNPHTARETTSTFVAKDYLQYQGFAAHKDKSRSATVFLWRAVDQTASGPQDDLQQQGPFNVLPIFVGRYQAAAMQRGCKNQTPQRPMTHDLLDTTVEALSADLERVSIDKLEDDIFHGTAWLRTAHGREIAIDARPSDLLAWTARRNVPVFVHRWLDQTATQSASNLTLSRLQTEPRRCF